MPEPGSRPIGVGHGGQSIEVAPASPGASLRPLALLVLLGGPARRGHGALPAWVALLLVALALVVRWPGLERSLWYDELFTLTHFADEASHAQGKQIAANNHPPASLIAWATGRLGGTSPTARRAPFALLGALSVGALALAVSALAGRRAGLVAGGLALLAPAHVLLAQQVRGYAGLLVAGSLLPLLVARAFESRPRRRDAEDAAPVARADRTDVALALVAGFGVWFHATLGLALVAWLALALVAPALGISTRTGRGVAVRGLLLGGGLGLVLLGPVLPRVLRHVRDALEPGAAPAHDLVGRLGASGLLELVRGKGAGALGAPLATLLLGLAAVGLARGLGADPGRRRAALVLLAPVLAAPLLVLLGAPDYPRLALFALPSLLGLAGLAVMPARPVRRALVPEALRDARPEARRALVRASAAVALALAALAAASLAIALSALATLRQAGEQLQDVRAAVRLARDRVGPAGLVVGGGPGGELISGFHPQARDEVDWEPALDALESRAGLGPHRPVAVVVPLPRFTPRDVAGVLAARCDPFLLPGLESPVIVWVARDGR